MRWFRDLDITRKLLAGISVILVCHTVCGGFGLQRMAELDEYVVELSTNQLPSMRLGATMRRAIFETGWLHLRHIQADESAELTAIESELQSLATAFEAAAQQLSSLSIDSEERRLLENLRDDWRAYLEAAQPMAAVSRAQRDEEAVRYYEATLVSIFERTVVSSQRLLDHNARVGDAHALAAGETYRSGRFWTVLGVIIVIAIGLTLGLGVGRAIAAPIRQIIDALDAVGNNDLTRRVAIHSNDEFGAMGKSLNRAIASMQAALSEVREIATVLNHAAQELATSASEISSGAQSQASSLEETTASLTQMTDSLRSTAKSASQASSLATGSHDIAQRGGGVVANAVDAMREINRSSAKISEIITTIDEIAFQTNILALNASVEAARAGEMGRGFAVVASEVGNLAQRSATAAKEIKTLIRDSVAKVESGTGLVNESGVSLNEIVISVKSVTDIVSEMAVSFRDQSSGLDQLSTAMTQMDSVTQRNAAQTEELSGTSESLARRAVQLGEVVGRFRLGNAGQRGRAEPRLARQRPAPSLKRSSPAAAPRPPRLPMTSGASLPPLASRRFQRANGPSTRDFAPDDSSFDSMDAAMSNPVDSSGDRYAGFEEV